MSTIAFASAEERNTYVVVLALAMGWVVWDSGILVWWQALPFAAGLIASGLALLYTPVRNAVLIFLIILALPLFVFTQLSIFWVVSGPDETVSATITDKYTRTSGGGSGGGPITTSYHVKLVEDEGHWWRVTIARGFWDSLGEGRRATITYHEETFAGRWLSHRVVTQLGSHSVVHGGGRFGTGMEIFGTLLTMVISAAPLGFLLHRWFIRFGRWFMRLGRWFMGN